MSYSWKLPEKGWMKVDRARKLAIERIMVEIKATNLIVDSGIYGATPYDIERRIGALVRSVIEGLSWDYSHPRFNREWGSPQYLERRFFYGQLPLEAQELGGQKFLEKEALTYAAEVIAEYAAEAVFELGGKYCSPELENAFEKRVIDIVMGVAGADEWLAYYLGRGPWCLLASQQSQQ